MKLQVVRVEIIESTSAAGLMALVNAYLATNSTREFIGPIQYQVSVSHSIARSSAAVIDSTDVITEFLPNIPDGTEASSTVVSYSAMITYTE